MYLAGLNKTMQSICTISFTQEKEKNRFKARKPFNACTSLTIVQWFTWGVSVGYEWLPTVVPLRNTVVPLKNIVDSTWVSQEL